MKGKDLHSLDGALMQMMPGSCIRRIQSMTEAIRHRCSRGIPSQTLRQKVPLRCIRYGKKLPMASISIQAMRGTGRKRKAAWRISRRFIIRKNALCRRILIKGTGSPSLDGRKKKEAARSGKKTGKLSVRKHPQTMPYLACMPYGQSIPTKSGLNRMTDTVLGLPKKSQTLLPWRGLP